MVSSKRESIHQQRRLLQNPYAYVEQLCNVTSSRGEPPTATSQHRRLLENPYAYLTGEGQYEALTSPARNPSKPWAWKNDHIQAKVREIHVYLWRNRERLWPERIPTDPVNLLDPAKALQIIGFDLLLEDGLGSIPGRSGQIEVAGVIDMSAKTVRVGRQFPQSVRTFTLAHELAHAVLHPQLNGLHRDKALDGVPQTVDRVETEADRFATLFLMPAKLVKTRFMKLFLAERFELNDDSAFALAGRSLAEVGNAYNTRRSLTRAIAASDRYNGCQFIPLHQQFRVSREAMAIRLEELSLA